MHKVIPAEMTQVEHKPDLILTKILTLMRELRDVPCDYLGEKLLCLKALWLSDAIWWHPWTGSPLLQVMACHLFGTKPLPKPKLTYHQLITWSHNSMKFNSKYKLYVVCKLWPLCWSWMWWSSLTVLSVWNGQTSSQYGTYQSSLLGNQHRIK